MTKAMGLALLSVGDALVEDQPDLVLLLGDRFEIVPVALAAVTHGITLAHLHGGETSRGALDEYYRHAVTKLANLHFPATDIYRRRILQMGEDPGRVFVHGAPGIDHLYRSRTPTRAVLARALGMPLDPAHGAGNLPPGDRRQGGGRGSTDRCLVAFRGARRTRVQGQRRLSRTQHQCAAGALVRRAALRQTAGRQSRAASLSRLS